MSRKKLRLVPHWKRVLTHGYSAWGVYIGITANLLLKALDYIASALPVALTIGILVLVLVVRLIQQDTMKPGEDE